MTTQDPTISVCLITYNHERYIAQAVNSVLAQQTKFPVEIVIGEDCSTDRTRAILLQLQSQHPDRIRLLPRDRNLGMMANFADAFAACRGKYVAMLEGDDYWTDPGKLQKQVEALESHLDWTIAFHRVRCVHEGGNQHDSTYPETVPRDVLTIDDMIRHNFIQTCSAVYRSGVISPLPEFLKELRLGDWPLALLHADRGGIGFLPEEMAVYRVHRQGVWSMTSKISRYQATLAMLAAVDRHFEGRYHRQISAIRRRFGAILFCRRCAEAILAPIRRIARRVAWLRTRLSSMRSKPERIPD